MSRPPRVSGRGRSGMVDRPSDKSGSYGMACDQCASVTINGAFTHESGCPDRAAFARWMRAVDRAIENVCGLTSADLGDQTFRDWYDDAMSPEDAARETLEDNGFPFD